MDAGAIPEYVISDFVARITAQARRVATIAAAAMGLPNRLNDRLRVPPGDPMLEIARGIYFEHK